VQALIAEIKDMVDRRCLGPSTASIVDAAAEKKVPHIRLNDGNLVQLGYGARQHRIWTAETDRTSAIAEGVASNKALTKSLLQSCGIPIPEGRVVDSPEDAWEAAQEIGLPVVVKPVDANHGRGVGLDLNTRAEVMNAYPLALENGSEVMVEQFIRGNEHRLLVVGQRMVAAASGESAWISGDGEHSVLELIDSQINSDPRRGFEEEFPLNWLNLQEHPEIRLVLERQGLTPESIPEPGRRVLIQHNGNVAFDVTDSVHPEVARLACLAARVVGLDVAGIDLVAQDISQPLQSQRGAIIEVNAGPGLLAHLKPASGQPRPVGMAILEHLIGTGQDGRIPVVGVLGDRDATLVAHLIAWFLQAAKQRVGLACADGLYLDSRMIASGDSTGYEAGERLLINRNVNAAVLEASCRSILSEGLAYDRCAVGVVTGMPAADDLAEFYIRDQDQVFNIVRTQVDVVLPGGVTVLSASLPCVEELAQLSDGEVLLYGQDVAHEAIAAQRRSGGRAVFLRQSTIVLAKGTEEIILFELAALRLARPAAPETILAAVAAGWALGITPALLVAALRSFNPEAETADV